MAKILYEVKRNQNSYSQAYGKWYAQIKSLETLNTRKLANHISEHGSIYTPDVVYGVLEKFRSCLVEILILFLVYPLLIKLWIFVSLLSQFFSCILNLLLKCTYI